MPRVAWPGMNVPSGWYFESCFGHWNRPAFTQVTVVEPVPVTVMAVGEVVLADADPPAPALALTAHDAHNSILTSAAPDRMEPC